MMISTISTKSIIIYTSFYAAQLDMFERIIKCVNAFQVIVEIKGVCIIVIKKQN